MKKIILLSTIVAFTLASCTKRYITKKEITNVVHEDVPVKGIVYSIMPKRWVSEGDTVLYASLDIPELTEDILDHGAVLVYLSFNDGEYEAIPEVFNLISYNALHYKGGVDIEMRDVDNRIIAPPTVEVWAKVVLIDAEKVAMHPNVNLNNLGEVKKTFHLP